MILYLQDLEETLAAHGIHAQRAGDKNLFFTHVQWLYDPREVEPHTLYVRDRNAPGQSGTVLLLQTELILLQDFPPEDALAWLMDMEEACNAWEDRVIQAILQGAPINTFLQIAAEPFHCALFLTDTNQALVGASPMPEADFRQVRNFLQVGDSLKPLEIQLSDNLTDFRDSLPESETHILATSLWHGRQYLGRLYLYHFQGTVHQGVIHRIQELAKLMGSYLAVNADEYFALSFISDVLKDAFHGRFTKWEQLRMELRAVGWEPEHSLRVIAIGDCPDPQLLSEIQEVILSRGFPCHTLQEAPRLVLLGNETLLPELSRKIANLMKRMDFPVSIGGSEPIRQLVTLPLYYRQAIFALRQALRHALPRLDIHEAALSAYRQVLVRDVELVNWVHPDLLTLRRQDQENGTQLLETLTRFLMSGCRYDATAQALRLHANTVRYRIRRICELMHTNLFDPVNRENLLLSLLVLPESGT